MKLDEDKLTRLNSPRSKEGNQRGEDETKSQSSPANEAKRVEAPSDKSNSPNSNEVVPNQSRESRQGLICPRSQVRMNPVTRLPRSLSFIIGSPGICKVGKADKIVAETVQALATRVIPSYGSPGP